MLERLQKILAEAGVGSRRECERIIAAGRVTVDGKRVTTLGMTVDADKSRICCDDMPIKSSVRFIIYSISRRVLYAQIVTNWVGCKQLIS